MEFGGTLRTTLNNIVPSPPVVCARWYFAFNGKECEPEIDGVVYESQDGDSHYPHQIGGFCQKTMKGKGIKKGRVDVEFRIGQCHHRSRQEEGNTHLGLDSVSRIVIREVPPPQNEKRRM